MTQLLVSAECIKLATVHKCHMTHTSTEHALTSMTSHNSDWPHGNGQRTPQTHQWPHHMHTMGKCVVGGAGRGRGVGERKNT